MNWPGSTFEWAYGINNRGEIVGTYRANANAEGKGFIYLNGKWTSYMLPHSTYTQLDGVNSLGDLTGAALTSEVNGELTGPGFLIRCR